MLSKTGIHAIKALSILTKLPEGIYAGAGEIAAEIAAPRNYLGKLLKTLADEGLLVSQKGKGGGFRLARDASKISLYEIMDPIDHVSRWSGCLFGGGPCSPQNPCALHGPLGKSARRVSAIPPRDDHCRCSPARDDPCDMRSNRLFQVVNQIFTCNPH